MSQTPHHKVKPRSGGSEIPPSVAIGGGLIVVLLLVVAIVAGLSNDNTEGIINATPIPAPVLVNNTSFGEGDTLYTAESIPFSVIAEAGNESTDQSTEACGKVIVTLAPEGFYFHYDNAQYWVYARRDDDTGWNGWLPLSALSKELPEGCPEAEQ
jgi:hypothetical protein